MDTLTVSQWLAEIADHGSSASGDIMFLLCHVTSQDHVIKESCEFIGRSSSWYVTTLTSLVTMGNLNIYLKVRVTL